MASAHQAQCNFSVQSNHTTHALPALQVNTAALKLQPKRKAAQKGKNTLELSNPSNGVMWSARPQSLHFFHRANDVLFSSSIFSTSLATCCSLPCCLSFVEFGCTDIRTPQTRNHAYQKPRPTQPWYLYITRYESRSLNCGICTCNHFLIR